MKELNRLNSMSILHNKWVKIISVNGLIVLLSLIMMIPDVDAQRRKHRRPSKSKNIAIGTAIGAIGGGLIGGRKGVLIGAGAGAGTGYGVYKYKQRKHRRRY